MKNVNFGGYKKFCESLDRTNKMKEILVKLLYIFVILAIFLGIVVFLLSLFPSSQNSASNNEYKTIGEFNQALKNCYSQLKIDPNNNENLFQLCLQDKECAECLGNTCDKYQRKPSYNSNYYTGTKDDCFISEIK